MIKIAVFETTYDYFLKIIFGIANPIKKTLKKTKCEVHKFININSLKILKNDGYFKEYNFFGNFIYNINEGAVWADQDFKSTNHFYNPNKGKGLFGRKSALDLGTYYYSQALNLWEINHYEKSLFYLGAALHIIQDMVIPQHANIRLLDDHRKYESYVKCTYRYVNDFEVESGAYLLNTIENYVKFNARIAIKIYNKFKSIIDDNNKFYRITKCTLPLAKRTTAGAMVMFYNDIRSHKS